MAAVAKIDVARIVMEFPDGMSAKARVSTIQAANHVLKSWIDATPEAVGQVCNVQITFEDGMQYRGQLTLDHSPQRFCLARHLRKAPPSVRHAATLEASKTVSPSVDRYDI